MTKTICTLFFSVLMAFTLHAQKFGHVNTAALLDALPDVEKADQILSAFQEGLIKGGESKAAAFEEGYKKYLADVNSGSLSKVQQTAQETALSKQQDEISQYEKTMQLQVLQKREDLLKPILEKIDVAIKEEGKAGGYTFIFDSSVSGALLFAQDSDDLLPAVKKRLGVQ